MHGGYTLDLDSWALLHEDGHQAGVAVGYTRLGLKPCHRTIAGLAEAKIANYWLRSGNTACVNGAAEFLRQTMQALPAHLRVGLVRGDSGFDEASVQDTREELGLKFIFVAKLTQKVQPLCRHDEAAWQATEMPGLAVQEVELERPGRRPIVIRQRVQDRPQAGGKTLLELEGYRFQALVTNLPASVDALTVWRRYNGRADLEKPDQGAGRPVWHQTAVRGQLLGHRALHHLAIAAQPVCALATAAGTVGKMRVEHLALAAVRPGGSGVGRAANPRSNWPFVASPIATGGGKYWPNSRRCPTAMQLPLASMNTEITLKTRATESFRLSVASPLDTV